MPLIQNSASRLIEIIKILLNKPASRDEICFELDKKGWGVYKNTLSKYFKTLKDSGFEIKKEKGRFKIIKTPFKIALDENEQKGLEILNSAAYGLYSKKDYEKYVKIQNKILNISKLNTPLDKTIKINRYKIADELFDKIDKLNGYINLKEAEIKFLYKNKEIIFAPRELKYTKRGVHLAGVDIEEDREKELKLDFISSIKLNSFHGIKKSKMPNNTAFKIKGRLKKNYTLKENENAIYLNNEMIIINNGKNKEKLLSRLVKYGKLTEVLYPDNERKEFIKKLEELIEHYNSI